jgi:hypothetical protein
VSTTILAPEVVAALTSLEEVFPGCVSSEPDGLGGAIVAISSAQMPARWPVSTSPLMFVVPFAFPAIPVYPYYIAAKAAPAGELGEGLQRIEWRGHSVLQLSLRHEYHSSDDGRADRLRTGPSLP